MDTENLSKFADWLEANPIEGYNCDNMYMNAESRLPEVFGQEEWESKSQDELLGISFLQFLILFQMRNEGNALRRKHGYATYIGCHFCDPFEDCRHLIGKPGILYLGDPNDQQLLIKNIRQMIVENKTRG